MWLVIDMFPWLNTLLLRGLHQVKCEFINLNVPSKDYEKGKNLSPLYVSPRTRCNLLKGMCFKHVEFRNSIMVIMWYDVYEVKLCLYDINTWGSNEFSVSQTLSSAMSRLLWDRRWGSLDARLGASEDENLVLMPYYWWNFEWSYEYLV